MDISIHEQLEAFGYNTRTSRIIAAQARDNGLTRADVAAWIAEATCSKTIRNPRGFVRASIARGDKPPAPDASRCHHFPSTNYVTEAYCPNCQARPCVCDWDPAKETLSEFRHRTAPTIQGAKQ